MLYYYYNIIDKYLKNESKQMALHFIAPLQSPYMRRMIERRYEYADINDNNKQHHDDIDDQDDDDIKEILLSHLTQDIYQQLYDNNSNNNNDNNNTKGNDNKAEALLDMILEKYGNAFLGEKDNVNLSRSSIVGILSFILFIMIWLTAFYYGRADINKTSINKI